MDEKLGGANETSQKHIEVLCGNVKNALIMATKDVDFSKKKKYHGKVEVIIVEKEKNGKRN